MLSLCDSYADTLAKAAALCRNDTMRAAVAELEALAVPLEKAGGVIRLDMTLAGEMEYYNGLVFQGYLKALPRPLLKRPLRPADAEVHPRCRCHRLCGLSGRAGPPERPAAAGAEEQHRQGDAERGSAQGPSGR